MPTNPNDLLAALRRVVEEQANLQEAVAAFDAACTMSDRMSAGIWRDIAKDRFVRAASANLNWPALLAAVEANERMREGLKAIIKHQEMIGGGIAVLSATRRIAVEALNPPASGKE